MKFLSVILILLAMKWSWGLIHSETLVPESIHVGIQEDMKNIISDFVKENLPEAKGLEFERIWTETKSENSVKVSFIYSFDDASSENGATRIQIEGYAMLNKSNSDTESETWSFDELYILDNKVEFQDALRISPNESDE